MRRFSCTCCAGIPLAGTLLTKEEISRRISHAWRARTTAGDVIRRQEMEASSLAPQRLYVQLALYAGGNALSIVLGLLLWQLWRCAPACLPLPWPAALPPQLRAGTARHGPGKL